ncbi:3,5-epimerase/4-reductase [Methylacidimicrobium cyclopophantes]|uniref:dTDP-4-dehydrorhamnose reductase n=1 Tax=Methylacidimicrobium cyclopophantes TaxID=1041766 RepID=A0A5E6MFA0_9BACT|nr:sugar nucleotide-binding protein [Methylacidimicrobium cyclopophantes]VVM06921.1 3,5-epimerase/4-reductase [Methylacidimicrobium cyclopophantes]
MALEKIVLFGGSGYVGSAFQRYFLRRGIPYVAPSHREVNLLEPASVARFLDEVKPKFLINAAGYTGRPNVDACEDHKSECLLGNAVLPGILARLCSDRGLPWGHVSSGCLYTGDRGIGSKGERLGFREEDPPNFCFRTNNGSFYSGTKALGEEILSDAASCYLWRLRIPFNEVDSSKNYLSKLLRYERLLDARNSLSQLDDFVRAAVECWERRAPFGIYNVVNPGSVTTRQVIDLLGRSPFGRRLIEKGKRFTFFAGEEEFRKVARAPRSNCVLDSSKLQSVGIHLEEVHDAVERAWNNWREATVESIGELRKP